MHPCLSGSGPHLPDDSREAERRLHDLRGWVKRARVAITGISELVETLARDWRRAVRFYARSGMEEEFRVLKDVLLMPVMPIFHRLDKRIRCTRSPAWWGCCSIGGSSSGWKRRRRNGCRSLSWRVDSIGSRWWR